ncbi:MAG: hypothetical protein ABJP48_06980 [Erythrobacter sp.]
MKQNDRAFVRFEQSQVQGALDQLHDADPDTYHSVVQNANAALNEVVPTLGSSFLDPTYAEAVSNAKINLGVEDLDFANEGHRVAIGDALTDILRER